MKLLKAKQFCVKTAKLAVKNAPEPHYIALTVLAAALLMFVPEPSTADGKLVIEQIGGPTKEEMDMIKLIKRASGGNKIVLSSYKPAAHIDEQEIANSNNRYIFNRKAGEVYEHSDEWYRTHIKMPPSKKDMETLR